MPAQLVKVLVQGMSQLVGQPQIAGARHEIGSLAHRTAPHYVIESSAKAPDTQRAGLRGAKPGPKPARVPASHTNAQETPLRAVEVKPGEQTLNFQLDNDKKK
jgi:hypothetical protein